MAIEKIHKVDCDRCSFSFHYDDDGIPAEWASVSIFLSPDGSSEPRFPDHYHFCPRCVKRLGLFMKGEEVQRQVGK